MVDMNSSGKVTFSRNCFKAFFGTKKCKAFCHNNEVFSVMCKKDKKLGSVVSILGSNNLGQNCPTYDACLSTRPGHFEKNYDAEIVECYSTQRCTYKCKNSARADTHFQKGVIECINGVWGKVMCTRYCDELPEILFGSYKDKSCVGGQLMPPSLRCEYKCEEGYKSSLADDTVECLPEGIWVPGPYCVKIQRVPVTITDANVCAKNPSNFSDNKVEVFKCFLNKNPAYCVVLCRSSRLNRGDVAIFEADERKDGEIVYKAKIACQDGKWEDPKCLPR